MIKYIVVYILGAIVAYLLMLPLKKVLKDDLSVYVIYLLSILSWVGVCIAIASYLATSLEYIGDKINEKYLDDK